MRKISILTTALLLTSMFTVSAFAAPLTINNQATPGAPIKITPVDTTRAFNFNPSSNVVISMGSAKTGYALGAYHSAAVKSKVGQEYGLAADTMKMMYKSLAAADAAEVITATGSSAFSDWKTL
ncbi:MAG: hypothetical protein ACK5PS_16185 [Desulfopila sp.]